MAKIKALKNFGFRGKHVEPGDVIEWDPDKDGDTMQSFIKAGLAKVVTEPDPKPAKPVQVGKNAKKAKA